ncbi:uncharacterized protein BDZ99DRAFT_548067 [Mytilinidion resinicola]|uniref:Uncharacterized protein n=1 Tax=Mytilinidion resinicola TaxID=574789 RepID=A0A6A6Y501_9PEZI|nr:uncharacterized protein BDZ99DRAFT_548067 [Mytilinidion resinicola]KAF2802867.1 hypothetical protein BDZ99DRAFT_548067 [Mytilinidion resinicola]
MQFAAPKPRLTRARIKVSVQHATPVDSAVTLSTKLKRSTYTKTPPFQHSPGLVWGMWKQMKKGNNLQIAAIVRPVDGFEDMLIEILDWTSFKERGRRDTISEELSEQLESQSMTLDLLKCNKELSRQNKQLLRTNEKLSRQNKELLRSNEKLIRS